MATLLSIYKTCTILSPLKLKYWFHLTIMGPLCGPHSFPELAISVCQSSVIQMSPYILPPNICCLWITNQSSSLNYIFICPVFTRSLFLPPPHLAFPISHHDHTICSLWRTQMRLPEKEIRLSILNSKTSWGSASGMATV